MMTPHRSSIGICLLTVFALCFALPGIGMAIDVAVPVIKQADVSSSIAINLVHGHGFVAEPGGEPILLRAPLYPAFLAVVYSLFGEHHEIAVFIEPVNFTAEEDHEFLVAAWREIASHPFDSAVLMGKKLFSDSSSVSSSRPIAGPNPTSSSFKPYSYLSRSLA